jgi:hypothetical protein
LYVLKLDCTRVLTILFLLIITTVAGAQDAGSTVVSPNAFPQYVRYDGIIPESVDSIARADVRGVTFAVYKDEEGGTPLWLEFHNLHVASDGRYSVVLGSLHNGGIDESAFPTNEPRWLGVQVQGKPEFPRVLLVSVPYALKALEADRLSPLATASILEAARAQNGVASDTFLDTSRLATATQFATNSYATYVDNNPTEIVLIQQNGIGYGLRALSASSPAIWAESSGTVWGALVGNSNSTTASGVGTVGLANGPGGYGVLGRATAPGGTGVRGDSNSSGGIGVYGVVTARSGSGVGITGETEADQGIGLYGKSNAPHGTTYGILGGSASDFGTGLRGNATHTQGSTIGVYATVFSPNGTAAVIDNIAGGKLLSGAVNGVEKFAIDGTGAISAASLNLHSSTGILFADGSRQTTAGAVGGSTIIGNNTNGVLSATQTSSGSTQAVALAIPPAALHGVATSQTNSVAGIVGESSSPTGFGVLGVNSAAGGDAIGMAGYSTRSPLGIGVYGEASSTDPTATPTGVFGLVSGTASGSTGVVGEAVATTGDTTGVYGTSMSTSGYGVEGDAYATTGIAIGVAGFSDSDQGRGVMGNAASPTGQTYGVRGLTESDAGTGVAGVSNSTTGATVGVSGDVASSSGVAGLFTNNSGGGDILVGRTGPGTTVFRVDSTGKAFFNGGTQTSGADFAENFAVRGDKQKYEPGDLLAIDETGARQLKRTDAPYSTLVAGVYSTKPGVLAQPYSIDSRQGESEVPLAVIGVVPLKVTTANGMIAAGDLLVSSPIEGRAMKGTDRARMLGAVVGKALEACQNGEKTILVLVTLQ